MKYRKADFKRKYWQAICVRWNIVKKKGRKVISLSLLIDNIFLTASPPLPHNTITHTQRHTETRKVRLDWTGLTPLG